MHFTAQKHTERNRHRERKKKYRISANSFRGNYSFLNLTLCTVTFGHSTYRCGNYSREETIQGRKLFTEIRIQFFAYNPGPDGNHPVFNERTKQILWDEVKAMKSSPLLGPFGDSEFWEFSLLKIQIGWEILCFKLQTIVSCALIHSTLLSS